MRSDRRRGLDKEDDHGAELRCADPDNLLTAGAFVPGGGFAQFIAEGLTGLNKAVLFVHTKYLLVDPLTEDPVVVTGSANIVIFNARIKACPFVVMERGDNPIDDASERTGSAC